MATTIMKHKKGKILKVILGMNPNCSAVWVSLSIVFLTVPLSLIISLVDAYLLGKGFKNARLLEDEVLKKAKKLRILQKLLIILIIGLIGIWGYYNWPIKGPIILATISLIIAILFSGFIGERMLFSKHPRLRYLVMPLVALLTVIILGYLVLLAVV